MSFGFGDGDVLKKQVEIAVNAVGQQAVDDLAARVKDLEAVLDSYKYGLATGAINTVEFVRATGELTRELGATQQQLAAARSALAGAGADLAALDRQAVAAGHA